MNPLGRDVFCKLLNDCQRIAGQRRATVRVIFIDESECAVRLDAIGEIRVAASDQNQVALERAVLVDRPSVIDARMEEVVCAKLREDRALGERLRRGSGHKKLVSVQRIDDFPGVEGMKLDAEVGVRKLGSADDLLDALRQ